MKNFKLKKLLTLITVTFITAVAMFPIKASAAWKQLDNGNWSYTQGNASVSGWKSIDGKWYFFDSNAIMKTGWILDGSSWYYVAPSGEMKTGWVNDGGKWYYTAPSGAMHTGWLSDNGVWYYINTSGAMQTGLVEVNNKTYYLNESGAMQIGNVTVKGINHTFAANGEKVDPVVSNPVATDLTITNPIASESSGGSGGSSGSGGGSSSSNVTTNTTGITYKDLYGNWIIEKHIDSNIPTKLDDTLINLGVGQEFNVEKDKISSLLKTISNPKVKESTITSSDFEEKWNDTFENVGISGDDVKLLHISDSSKSSNYVDVLVADSGTYALLRGSLFELKKQ